MSLGPELSCRVLTNKRSLPASCISRHSSSLATKPMCETGCPDSRPSSWSKTRQSRCSLGSTLKWHTVSQVTHSRTSPGSRCTTLRWELPPSTNPRNRWYTRPRQWRHTKTSSQRPRPCNASNTSVLSIPELPLHKGNRGHSIMPQRASHRREQGRAYLVVVWIVRRG